MFLRYFKILYIRLGWHLFSRGDIYPGYPLMQSKIIILYWMLIKYIVYITFGFKTIQVKWIFQTLIRRQSESMVNRTRINSAQSIFFLEYHPSSSNITRCQVQLRVRVWFHDSEGDIIFFYQNVSQPIRINYFTWKYNMI